MPAAGVCDGDVLKVCDPETGLVTTDCSGLAMTPVCGQNGDGALACVPGDDTPTPTEGGGDDTTTPDTASGGSDGNDDAGADNTTIACTCRNDSGGWGGLWFGALGLAFIRPRRRR